MTARSDLDVLGEPLRGAVRGAPYKFTFDERSSGSRLSGRGELPQAFDFSAIDVACEAAGSDLKDLYYLTGVHLIDTGSYHLTGLLARRGLRTTFSKLEVSSGESDMHGSVVVDAGAARRRLSIDLHSHVLRLGRCRQARRRAAVRRCWAQNPRCCCPPSRSMWWPSARPTRP